MNRLDELLEFEIIRAAMSALIAFFPPCMLVFFLIRIERFPLMILGAFIENINRISLLIV